MQEKFQASSSSRLLILKIIIWIVNNYVLRKIKDFFLFEILTTPKTSNFTLLFVC